MRDEFDDLEGQETTERYERMLEMGETWYFDLDQIEEIVDHYFYQGLEASSLRAVEFGLSIFPDAPVLLLRKSQLQAAIGDQKQALISLLDLLEIEPFNDEIHLTLATIYSQQGDHPHAVHHFKMALKYCERDVYDDIILDLAHEYENHYRIPDAIKTLKKALAHNPKNDLALYELAYLNDSIAENKRAIQFFHEFIDEQPYSSAAWYNLGQIYMLDGQADQAIKAFGYCLAIKEDFRDAHISLGHALFSEEQYEEAIASYLEGVNKKHPQPPLYCCIGECKMLLKQYREALRYFGKAVKANSDYMDAWLGMAMVYDEMGDQDNSLINIRKAYKLEPGNAEVALVCGSMHMKAGMLDESILIFENLVTVLPNSIDGWINLSDCHIAKGHRTIALQKIEAALAENHDHPTLLYRKVAYLHLVGKKKEALLLLRHLADQEPQGLADLLAYYPDFIQEEEVLQIVHSTGN